MKNWEAYQSGKYRRLVNQGSSRSSKTYSIMQILIIIASTTKKHISVTSPSLPHLKRGAYFDFLKIAGDWGLYSEKYHNKTENRYNFPSGGLIEFFGADNPGMVRGPGRDILFCNEANLFKKSVYTQLCLRTREVVFIDFNPADEVNFVYNEAERDDACFIRSTYRNNLANLSSAQVAEIEALRDADTNLWRVFGLGLRGTSSETIYTNFQLIDKMPEFDDWSYGLDFGFNHKTALIQTASNHKGLFSHEIFCEAAVTSADIILALDVYGVPKTKPIYCDAARPDMIEEIYRAGWNAQPANKSVLEGITYIKSRPQFITKSSANLLKEKRSYKWKKDKNDNVLDEPVKFMDDCCDAERYGHYSAYIIPKTAFDLLNLDINQ